MNHRVIAQYESLRIERVGTHGKFELDGGSWEVDNNIWIVGDNSEAVIIDAAHESTPIIDAVEGSNVIAVACTHCHNDHITVAPELGETLLAPVLLHPAEAMLWSAVHGDTAYWPLHDRQRIGVCGIEIEVRHAQGHSPGSVCLYAPELAAVFSGDALFSAGPGATGRSYSYLPTVETLICQRGGKLPDDTIVHTGHGDRVATPDPVAL